MHRWCNFWVGIFLKGASHETLHFLTFSFSHSFSPVLRDPVFTTVGHPCCMTLCPPTLHHPVSTTSLLSCAHPLCATLSPPNLRHPVSTKCPPTLHHSVPTSSAPPRVHRQGTCRGTHRGTRVGTWRGIGRAPPDFSPRFFWEPIEVGFTSFAKFAKWQGSSPLDNSL